QSALLGVSPAARRALEQSPVAACAAGRGPPFRPCASSRLRSRRSCRAGRAWESALAGLSRLHLARQVGNQQRLELIRILEYLAWLQAVAGLDKSSCVYQVLGVRAADLVLGTRADDQSLCQHAAHGFIGEAQSGLLGHGIRQALSASTARRGARDSGVA